MEAETTQKVFQKVLRKIVDFGLILFAKTLPICSPGKESTMPFSRTFRPWGTLGGQNGPRTPPKSFWDSPDLTFS